MMDKQHIHNYLSTHGIRKTPFRIELLGLFLSNKHSLSHKDIKERITTTQDKVTIYRALDTFSKKGLIHKVPDANNLAKYALCLHECSEKSHCNNHAHFICNTCKNTFCLDEIQVPKVKNTKGFEIKTTKLTFEGECPDCLAIKESNFCHSH